MFFNYVFKKYLSFHLNWKKTIKKRLFSLNAHMKYSYKVDNIISIHFKYRLVGYRNFKKLDSTLLNSSIIAVI